MGRWKAGNKKREMGEEGKRAKGGNRKRGRREEGKRRKGKGREKGGREKEGKMGNGNKQEETGRIVKKWEETAKKTERNWKKQEAIA